MKRSKKLFIWEIMVSVLLMTQIGCHMNAQNKAEESLKIGIALYNQYDTFVSAMMNDLQEYAIAQEKEWETDIIIDIYNASGSQIMQNEQVEKMIEDGCDVVCVNLVDRTEPTVIIDMAEKNKIPVIFFNRELVEEDLERGNNLYYVGAKTLESGIMQGEIAAAIFKNNVKADKNADGIFQYVVLEGEAGHQDAIVRTEYSVSTIVDNGVRVEKLGYAIANWNRAQSQTKMAHMLLEYGENIELVLANNDDMALGVVDALKTAEIPTEEWPVVLGIDGTEIGIKAVKNREMAGTVYNDANGQAERMLDLAYELCIGGELERLGLEDGKYIRLPYAKVEPDDVDKFLHSQSSDSKPHT